ncbi:4Fe-4S binding protein [Methanobrevibacter sp. DSM 116169]|uniref:4Fe-4S binding protein n=1 Tax=Methanobrevibacter sp. DSM 116169 TaxID=3242727 RepID=UPI0038FBEA3B
MIIFNEDGCIKCGACEGTCPSAAIDVTEKQIIHCDMCNGEPKCAEICPEGAYKVESIIIDENADPQPRLTFNSIACNQCGKCVEICPQEILELSDDKKMPVEGFCVMCQKCVNICPVDVIGISGIKEPKSCELDILSPIFIHDCVGCGACVEFCPVDAISLDNVGDSINIDESTCIKCGVCSQTCPWNAVFISGIKNPYKRSKDITKFTLDEDTCIGCNTCIEACPGDFIKSKDSDLTVKLPKICAACGLCEQLCPTDAIDLEVEWGDARPATDVGLVCDSEKCDKIGACALKCPTEAIRVVTKKGMQVPEQEQSSKDPSFTSCAICGACASVCPTNALSMGSIQVDVDGESVTRDRVNFNPSKCDQCGDCIDACPYDMLKLKDSGKLPIVGFCTLCGQCKDACPEEALSFK